MSGLNAVQDVRLQIGLRHAHRAVALADPGVDARAVRRFVVTSPCGVLVGERHGGDRLRPVRTLGGVANGLFRPDDVTGRHRDRIQGRGEIGSAHDDAGSVRKRLQLLQATKLIALGVKLVGAVRISSLGTPAS